MDVRRTRNCFVHCVENATIPLLKTNTLFITHFEGGLDHASLNRLRHCRYSRGRTRRLFPPRSNNDATTSKAWMIEIAS
jgi:hypothetical protein